MGRIEGNVKEANASSSGDVEDLGGDATGHDGGTRQAPNGQREVPGAINTAVRDL